MSISNQEYRKYIRKRINKFYNYLAFFFTYKTFFNDFEFYISKTRTQDELDEMYKLRYQVYCEEYEYIDKNRFPNKLETDEYDNYSDHFIMRDKHHEIAAMVRVIKYSHLGFPCEKHFKIEDKYLNINKNHTVEISRLIVAKKYRKRKLLLFLIKGLFRYALSNQIEYAYSVFDSTLYPVLKNLRVPFKIVGPSSNYQGITFPCIVAVSEWIDELSKDRILNRFFFYGGIDTNGDNKKYVIH